MSGVLCKAPTPERLLPRTGKTGAFEFAGTRYLLEVNSSGSTAAIRVANPEASAFSLLYSLSDGAPIVIREVPGGLLYQATDSQGQVFTLRRFSSTSAQTGVPEWTLQGTSGSLPGGIKEIKFRDQ